ncbi:glycosyltransferase [Nonlabens antarcticus]|uniref:glycosyltransferase n=1 Tax=Nonlabens antarcticus TaxID=392714 RepID=UPI0018912E1D|nr:glycosyltransferase [Nonlabens antarcticus]
MRILLVGEYSNYHNSLKHGLIQLGHEVIIVGDGDGFKDLPVDVFVGSDYYRRNRFREKFKVAWWKLTGRNLEDNLRLARFRESEHLLKGFDIVQFINSNPFSCEPPVEMKMLKFLVENNGKCFLAACGDDYHYADYLTNYHEGYSILEAVKIDSSLKPFLWHTYKYLGPEYKANYEWLVDKCVAIIPSNVDYAMTLTRQIKTTEIIPAPIIIDKYQLEQNENTEVIQIFLGINRQNYWKKGINYFEEALLLLKEKYNNQVNVTVAENLPYVEYMTRLKDSHILLDQVLSYDQGYNALESMLKGKVVFAGAGPEFLKAHNLKNIAVINAQPDVSYLFEQISMLIENPESLLYIGKNARRHVVKFHDSVMIASLFVKKYKF